MELCSKCHTKPITRYKGLRLCNPCYYAIRPQLKQISTDDVVCVKCKNRPARYKVTQLCHACQMASYCQRIGPAAVKQIRDTWKAKQSTEWRAKRAKAERKRRKQMGEEYRVKERERNKRRSEQRRAYNQRYYALHAEERRKESSEYRKAHPEWVSEVKRKRRTRAVGLPATLTEAEWQIILNHWNHSCSYCGKRNIQLVKDHAVPLSRGGGYTADNIRPACWACNCRKHDKTAEEFIALLRSPTPE